MLLALGVSLVSDIAQAQLALEVRIQAPPQIASGTPLGVRLTFRNPSNEVLTCGGLDQKSGGLLFLVQEPGEVFREITTAGFDREEGGTMTDVPPRVSGSTSEVLLTSQMGAMVFSEPGRYAVKARLLAARKCAASESNVVFVDVVAPSTPGDEELRALLLKNEEAAYILQTGRCHGDTYSLSDQVAVVALNALVQQYPNMAAASIIRTQIGPFLSRTPSDDVLNGAR